MLNRAPNVYIPIEPEDNGIAIPAVLSVIVHVAILAFIIFSHRIPDLEEPEPIETTLITPEELAAVQSNIAANREAMAAQKKVQSVEVDSAASESSTVSTNSNQQPIREDISARPIPTEPQETSSFPSILSSEDPTTEPTTEATNPFSEEAPNNDPIEGNADNHSEDPKPVDKNKPGFAAEDNPYAKSGANGLKNGPKKSKGQIANDLLNYIKPRWSPDQKFVGTKITAYITVDENGNVLSVTTNAKDPDLSDSLIKAIDDASPLTPIAGSGYTKLELEFIVRKK